MIDEAVQARPAPALRPYVAWYTGYRQAGIAPGRHRGLPSPYLTMIITIDDPLVIEAHPDPGQPGGTYTTLVGGLHTVPALITHDGRQSGVQLALHPLGARALLGLPAGEIGHLDVCGEDVLGPIAVELHERLRAAATWPARFAVLDAVLTRACAGRHRPDPAPELTEAWRLLVAGDRTVADTADAVGWSLRRLSSRFGAETGVSPKTAAKIARFDRVRRRLVTEATRRPSYGPMDRRDGLGLADLAVACGYYDQAHLARDFRELAGAPPSQWLAEESRFVQAHGDAPEAG
ncbi:helix-turn-helix domain-containing protein [Cryptosporangium aurantiacum]|uniref:helix-turn-helix domain-containing protein n=1 Tax=Cryptosporangium aurantiacum TaxID=134849 RepID=UPI0009322CDB|nr:helix-turn-helix domain-containing protein [Cryptosporangium aurantiacum]